MELILQINPGGGAAASSRSEPGEEHMMERWRRGGGPDVETYAV